MTNSVQDAKIVCLLPLYIDKGTMAELLSRPATRQSIHPDAGTWQQHGEEWLLNPPPFAVRCTDTGLEAVCQPLITMYGNSYLLDQYVAMLSLQVQFNAFPVDLHQFISFVDHNRRLYRSTPFSVQGADISGASVSPADIA